MGMGVLSMERRRRRMMIREAVGVCTILISSDG